MTLFLLTHHNYLDYYVKEDTNLGIYTTREKATKAMERSRAGSHEYHKAPLLNDLPADEQDQCYLYYEIEEVAVDTDWF